MVDAPVTMGEVLEGAGHATLVGRVLRVVFHDPNTRYLVARVQQDGELGGNSLVGRFAGTLEEGARIRAIGVWGQHATHGDQFEFSRLEVERPTTELGVLRRLQRYPGIRDVIAQRIVDRFGTEALDILDAAPDQLLEVEGIGKKTLERIREFHVSREGPLVALENRLVELDLPPRLADSLHRRYGDGAMEVLESQPYRLARELRGVGFATADRIARALGVARDAPERIDAGVVHALERAEREGHCALPLRALVESSSQVLGRPAHEIELALDRLVEEGDLIFEGEGDDALAFVREHLLAEASVTRALVELALAESPQWKVSGLPDELSPGQVRAVQAIADSGVVVLTGGPGTGKSTVVRNVLDLALANGSELLLCAPTGRAAKRLEQTTGQPCKTVHRLLEIQGESGEFFYNANNPLPEGLVVVDEASMLDLALAEALLTSLTPAHRLMLVGDVDQLPSVGPGNVLRDIIVAAGDRDSPIPVVRLDQIFRQAEGSSIVVNAHRVLEGAELAPDPAGAKGQFFFTRARDAARAHEVIVTLAAERIPEVYGLDPVTEVQILCPMHKGASGTDAFNTALQKIHTAGAPALELPGLGAMPTRRFCVGDRVMQTKNDYQRAVFNGDIGTVSSVDPEDMELTVDFEGTPVRYEQRELAALRLAYAISIHKSQGSEFPAVLIPLLAEHHVMLRRNLLYTAMTRARELCLLVGDPRAVERAIARADAAKRHTGLAPRLQRAMAGALGATVVELDPGGYE